MTCWSPLRQAQDWREHREGTEFLLNTDEPYTGELQSIFDPRYTQIDSNRNSGEGQKGVTNNSFHISVIRG